MPIPTLTNEGFLPLGVHDCSLAELRNAFGAFNYSDRRPQLFRKLEEFVNALKGASIKMSVIVDGSFVTGKPEPNDIDLILVLPSGWQFNPDASPSDYNVLSRGRVKRLWGFDLLIARADTKEYDEYVALFQRVRYRRDIRKGVLRLQL